MTTIYHVWIEDDNDLGEYDAFFDEEGNFIHGWDGNDANYRNEYMDPLMQALGVTVVSKPKTRAYVRAIKTALGYT